VLIRRRCRLSQMRVWYIIRSMLTVTNGIAGGCTSLSFSSRNVRVSIDRSRCIDAYVIKRRDRLVDEVELLGM
jgi:hypothetical protein